MVKVNNCLSSFYIILVTVIVLFMVEVVSGFVYKSMTNKTSYIIESNASDLYEDYTWANSFFKSRAANKHPNYSYFPYAMWTTRDRDGEISQDSMGVRKSYIPKKTGKQIYRIYTFGGSTMENVEVPNDYTIASNLVRFLSTSELSKKFDFEIVNFGSGAYVSSQSMIRLIYEIQREFKGYGKPNMVIFYNGVNDIFSGVYLERPGLHDAYDRIELRYNNINGFYLMKLNEWIHNNINFIKLIDYLFIENIEEDLRYFKHKKMNYRELSGISVNIYNKNIDIIKSLGATHNFKSIFFIQPSIYTLSDGSSYDANVLNKWVNKRKNMYKAFTIGYKPFIQLASQREDVVDFTRIFSGMKKPIYRDYCHVGPFANEYIASNIFDYVYNEIDGN